MENLVGRKVKGFKFESGRIVYSSIMDDFIGKTGEIKSVGGYSFRVDFGEGRSHFYPLDQITEHLVPEYEIGKEYEFAHKSMNGWDNRKLLAVLPTSYKDRFIVTSDLTSSGWTYMSEIREIKEQKETEIIYFDNQRKRVTVTIQGEVLEINEKIKK